MVVRGIMNVAQRLFEPSGIVAFSAAAYEYLGPHAHIATGIAAGAGFVFYGISEGLKHKLAKPKMTKAQKIQAKLDKVTAKAQAPKLTRKQKKEAVFRAKLEQIAGGLMTQNAPQPVAPQAVAPQPVAPSTTGGERRKR